MYTMHDILSQIEVSQLDIEMFAGRLYDYARKEKREIAEDDSEGNEELSGELLVSYNQLQTAAIRLFEGRFDSLSISMLHQLSYETDDEEFTDNDRKLVKKLQDAAFTYLAYNTESPFDDEPLRSAINRLSGKRPSFVTLAMLNAECDLLPKTSPFFSESFMKEHPILGGMLTDTIKSAIGRKPLPKSLFDEFKRLYEIN